ncbi:glycerophosphodiester phosphodiesterase [Streptococcus suis]|uniref:glycerophosphodiester phosphodiesterase n=1 Tax=Streptococcus suis TaxID=1307 RepID=UPI001DC8821C|nr:glycerophosphodiester phosphodiesterase [Streptococcus suis]MBS8082277.1 glycerophosphodiester phosphodiesterase [Streptococcus suis]MBS8084402.1 glycerophosphodiester phosphodiesterase [Streptococcus suis]MBS8112130.1 glycerophosphodiester phosphodiesterase [Streptococcus suis]
MKKIQREFQKIYYNLDKILLLFFTLFTFMEFVWIPLNSWISEGLLAMTGHAYLSPTNLLSVFAENLLVTGLFILLFFVNIAIAYLELALLFTGVWQLLDEKVKHLPDYLRDVRDSMVAIIRHSSLPKVLFLLFYSVILLPFLRRVLNIYYFNKIVVPQFIVDYLSNTIWLGILIFLLLFFWLAARFMYALPNIYFEHRGVKESIAYSWEKTRGRKQIGSLFRLIWLITFPVLLFTGVGGLFYLVQLLAEHFVPSASYWLAVVCYALLKLAYYGVVALFMMGFVSLLTGKQLPIYRRKRLRHHLRLAILLVSGLVFGTQGALALYFPFDTLPVTISHRGVDDGNAVQNSIEALEKTSQLKPDYIEMDVQETKDGQFIVMHDTDLLALTGNPGGTHDYTLAELTGMTASENGMAAPVPSFDEYLEKADELGQKLLVEIKVTKADSPKLTQNFLKKYGQRLIAKGHQMQSLDYRTIIEIKQYSEKLVSFFILPFNSIYPTTVADGYTMEYTSLDQNFMTKSWIRGKSVYAWTPNDEESMTKMLLLQVDGIITDNMTDLQSLMEEMKENRHYPDLFFLQFQSLIYNFE